MNLEINLDTQSKDGTLTPSKIAAVGTFVFPSIEITATDKAFLLPRLTTTERNNLVSPIAGSEIYNTDTNQTEVYNGTMWTSGGGGGGGSVVASAELDTVTQGGAGGRYGPFSLFTPTADGMYRISFYSVVTTAGSSGDNSIFGVEWTDTENNAHVTGEGGFPGSVGALYGLDVFNGTGAVLFQENMDQVGAFFSCSYTMECKAGTPISYNVSRGGTGGSETHLSVVLEALQESGGGGGTPGGADTQLQYNSSGTFAGSPHLIWDSTKGDGRLEMPFVGDVFHQVVGGGLSIGVSPGFDDTVVGGWPLELRGLDAYTIQNGMVISAVNQPTIHSVLLAGDWEMQGDQWSFSMTNGPSNAIMQLRSDSQGSASEPFVLNFYDNFTNTNWGICVDTLTGALKIGTGVGLTQVDSLLLPTTGGFVPSNLTTIQRDAIVSPATGLQIYNTTTNQPEVYNGTAWVTMGGGGGGSATFYNEQFTYSGSNVFALTATPAPNSEVVTQNGLVLHPTSGYTLSGPSLTVLTVLTGGDTIQITYATDLTANSVTFGDDVFTIAGSNVLALSDTPIAGSEVITQNGLVLRPTDGYTLSGTTLTIITVTDGDIIQAKYQVIVGSPTTPPAGANTQVQFNASGAFGASSGLTYDETAYARLTVGPILANAGTEFRMLAAGNNFLSFDNEDGTTNYGQLFAGADTGGTLNVVGSASNLHLESTNGDITFTVGSGGNFRSSDANFSYNEASQTVTAPTLSTAGAQMFFTQGTMVVGQSASSAVAPAVNNGIIYYDQTDQKFKASENGGAFVNLVGGSGTPAGLNGDIQFNNAGAFGNASDGDGQGYLRWDDGASTLRTYKLDVDAPDLGNATLLTVHSAGPVNNGSNNYEIGQTTASTVNATPFVAWSMALDDDTVYSMEMRVVARDIATGDAAQIILKACYKRVTGGNVVQVGTTEKLSNQDDPSWDANYVINSTNLDVTVTGDASNTVLWNITTIVQHVGQG